MSPRLSVIIRSYNRLPALCELVGALLAQDHDSFEIVVIDQSTQKPDAAVATLAEYERDARLRILRFPLGIRVADTGFVETLGCAGIRAGDGVGGVV